MKIRLNSLALDLDTARRQDAVTKVTNGYIVASRMAVTNSESEETNCECEGWMVEKFNVLQSNQSSTMEVPNPIPNAVDLV